MIGCVKIGCVIIGCKTYEFNLEVMDTKGEATTVESKLQASEPLGPFIG